MPRDAHLVAHANVWIELNASRNKIQAAQSRSKATLNTLHLFIYSFIYK